MFSFLTSIGRSSKAVNEIPKVMVKDGAACVILACPLFILWSSSFTPPSPKQIASQTPAPQHVRVQPHRDLPWYDIQRFYYHIQTRLPKYRHHFEEVAQQYGLPWTLLAAQAYQESRWDKHAKSPTGVRGLMMLTRNTASSLGIKNRLDPKKSIEGGAKYFAYLRDRIPETIPHPDRTFIALAAYNVGMGHIQDAQGLAKNMNKNPFSWDELKTVLPLLAKKQYYRSLRFGYARGWEPVQYVKRIRAYHALLEQYFREI